MKAKAIVEREGKESQKRFKQKFQKDNKTHVIPDSLVESNLSPHNLRKPRYDANGTGENKVLEQNSEVSRLHCKYKRPKVM